MEYENRSIEFISIIIKFSWMYDRLNGFILQLLILDHVRST